MKKEEIERAILEGHIIAKKIREASSISDTDNLSEEVDNYCDFVDNNFGQIDDFSENDELFCDLSFYLRMALETKERHLSENISSVPDYGNEGVDTFERFLDSKQWANYKK